MYIIYLNHIAIAIASNTCKDCAAEMWEYDNHIHIYNAFDQHQEINPPEIPSPVVTHDHL